MNLNFIPILLLFVYFFYLVNIFQSEIFKRNYLKLYNNRKYLSVQMVISALFILYKVYFGSSMKNTDFFPSTLPISFILLSLVLNAISIKTHQRPFKFYLRGDRVKWISHDMLFSFILFLGSVALTFCVDSLF